MHGPMLERLIKRAVGTKSHSIDTTVWQSLALANAMTAMATRRDRAGLCGEHLVSLRCRRLTVARRGGVGIEAPRRDRQVLERYFDLNSIQMSSSTASSGMRRRSLRPSPKIRVALRAMAEGALIRLDMRSPVFRALPSAGLWRG